MNWSFVIQKKNLSAPWGPYPPYYYPYTTPSWLPPNNGAGILGARPLTSSRTQVGQAYFTAVAAPASHQVARASWPSVQPMEPAALGHYFDTTSLRSPADNNWYMDSGATSHMTHNTGTPEPEGDTLL